MYFTFYCALAKYFCISSNEKFHSSSVTRCCNKWINSGWTFIDAAPLKIFTWRATRQQLTKQLSDANHFFLEECPNSCNKPQSNNVCQLPSVHLSSAWRELQICQQRSALWSWSLLRTSFCPFHDVLSLHRSILWVWRGSWATVLSSPVLHTLSSFYIISTSSSSSSPSSLSAYQLNVRYLSFS